MGKIKYNTEIVKNICLENGYILMSEYDKYHKPIYAKDMIGYIYKTEFHYIKNNNNIRFIGKHNPYTIQNIKLWCKLNNKPFELVSDKYISPHKNLLWRCLKENCGEIFPMPWSRASQDYGCGYCHGKQLGISNCLATKFPDIAKQWHPTKNDNLTPYDVTYGSRQYVWWLCDLCNYEWYVRVNSRTSFNTGCPECQNSKGEKIISQYLLDSNFIKINQTEYIDSFKYNYNYYIPQKEFNGLVGLGNGNLSYDFYLPNQNLLIEFQGEQHEKYIPGLHKSKKDFERQLEHDKRKREYAKNNNIKLLEIWYWDFDNIEEILNNYLN